MHKYMSFWHAVSAYTGLMKQHFIICMNGIGVAAAAVAVVAVIIWIGLADVVVVDVVVAFSHHPPLTHYYEFFPGRKKNTITNYRRLW